VGVPLHPPAPHLIQQPPTRKGNTMQENNQSPLNKIKDAIPDNLKDLAKKAIGLKYFKFIAGGFILFIAVYVLTGANVIPPDDVIYKLVAADEEMTDKSGSVEMTSFTVDFCKEVENERRINVAECTITYQTTIRTKATNYMRRIPAKIFKVPESTEQFRFWQNDEDKWVMERLY
jgi:hypothetical protein